MRCVFYLFCAILLEAAGTTSMKLSGGFTRLAPSLLLIVFYSASLGMLTFALVGLEVSVAYAVWSGIGTVLIAAVGMAAFGESVSVLKFISIGLIVTGVVLLNLGGARG